MDADANSPDEERPTPARRPAASRAAGANRGKATASGTKAAASKARKPAASSASKPAAAKAAPTPRKKPATSTAPKASTSRSKPAVKKPTAAAAAAEPAPEPVVSDPREPEVAEIENETSAPDVVEDQVGSEVEVVEPEAVVTEPVIDEPEPEPEPEPVVEEARPEPVAPPAPRAEPEPEPAATAPADATAPRPIALSISKLTKRFGRTLAVDAIDLDIPAGSLFGIVGPNGAGKTTTLSMVTGLLRPDSGSIAVHGADVWTNAAEAKRSMGVLPDRLRLFDRLTGSELLFYAGALRGLDRATIRSRAADLATAFGLEPSLGRHVSDYSVGMTKKIAIAAAMIHSPRLLVLDEPFESVDPVSAATVVRILEKFVAAGGTVVMSSHSMDLIERVCDSVAVIVDGAVLASGPLNDVLQGASLEERFVDLAGGRSAVEGMEWLQSYSD
ncbi:MAG: ABC transporter ATP-binding protein [Microbacteriaceae bacterium]